MRDTLIFNTKKKRDVAIAGFTSLLSQPGWKLMEEILDFNIEIATKCILTKINLDGEKATEKEMDGLRDGLEIYKQMKDTPHRHIKKLSAPPAEESAKLDPYQTVDELKEERRKLD